MGDIEEFKKNKVEETIDEAIQLLNKYKKAIILRPVGFGKTYSLVQISQLFDYTIYLYPRDVIMEETMWKYKDILQRGKIQFCSYQGLAKYCKDNGTSVGKFDEEKISQNRVLLVVDEAHFAGAKLWGMAIKQLLMDYPNLYLLGATATPDRSDGIDVIYDFFDGHDTSRYLLSNAIDDGIYKKPLYVFSVSEVISKVNERRNAIEKSDKVSSKEKKAMLDNLDNFLLNNAIFEDNADIIRRNCFEEYGNVDYLKFMVFFCTYENLYSQYDSMVSWFKQAFLDKFINILVVGSKPEMKGNNKKIHTLKYTPGQIDVIVSIDMLSYGVHIEDVNCVVMLRGTCSDIIFMQQLGRALSITNNKASIIFDLIGNINRKQYKAGARVIDQKAKKNKNGTVMYNALEGLKDRIRSKDYVADFMELDRLTDFERRSNEKKWVDAVLYKNCPLEIAMNRLGLGSIEDVKNLVDNFY